MLNENTTYCFISLFISSVLTLFKMRKQKLYDTIFRWETILFSDICVSIYTILYPALRYLQYLRWYRTLNSFKNRLSPNISVNCLSRSQISICMFVDASIPASILIDFAKSIGAGGQCQFTNERARVASTKILNQLYAQSFNRRQPSSVLSF
jgi:hypothetical protein